MKPLTFILFIVFNIVSFSQEIIINPKVIKKDQIHSSLSGNEVTASRTFTNDKLTNINISYICKNYLFGYSTDYSSRYFTIYSGDVKGFYNLITALEKFYSENETGTSAVIKMDYEFKNMNISLTEFGKEKILNIETERGRTAILPRLQNFSNPFTIIKSKLLSWAKENNINL